MLELLYVSLAVMGAVVVLLGARLVAQRRAAEFTLMRARGAALYQLGWLCCRASLVIAVAAGAVAAVLAIGLTPGDGDAVSWWLAGLTLAVTLAGPVLVSVVPQRVAAPLTGRAEGEGAARRAGGRRPAARRIVIEVALVAAAIGGLIVLRNQGLSSGGRGLYTSAAPVLVAIPVAVVVLRCYPPLARELARIAGRSRGVVAFVGLARATRTPPGTACPRSPSCSCWPWWRSLTWSAPRSPVARWPRPGSRWAPTRSSRLRRAGRSPRRCSARSPRCPAWSPPLPR